MIKRCFGSIILLTVIMLFAVGCAEDRALKKLAKDYGNSARLAKVNQTLNPDAEKNLEPVYGLDGNAAEATINMYRRSFLRQTIPFGGGAGGAGGGAMGGGGAGVATGAPGY